MTKDFRIKMDIARRAIVEGYLNDDLRRFQMGYFLALKLLEQSNPIRYECRNCGNVYAPRNKGRTRFCSKVCEREHQAKRWTQYKKDKLDGRRR